MRQWLFKGITPLVNYMIDYTFMIRDKASHKFLTSSNDFAV